MVMNKWLQMLDMRRKKKRKSNGSDLAAELADFEATMATIPFDPNEPLYCHCR